MWGMLHSRKVLTIFDYTLLRWMNVQEGGAATDVPEQGNLLPGYHQQFESGMNHITPSRTMSGTLSEKGEYFMVQIMYSLV